jgi:hypothetical protein
MKIYKKECKPWQKQHKLSSHFYYTDENGERRHTFMVSLRYTLQYDKNRQFSGAAKRANYGRI